MTLPTPPWNPAAAIADEHGAHDAGRGRMRAAPTWRRAIAALGVRDLLESVEAVWAVRVLRRRRGPPAARFGRTFLKRERDECPRSRVPIRAFAQQQRSGSLRQRRLQ